MSARSLPLLTSLLITLSLTAVPSVFAVSCGDVIITETTLDTDLLNCPDNPALTVQAVPLNLNGHTVTCQTDATDGIHLTGQGAQLRNGVVRDCFDGVVLMGTGHHLVERVLSTNNTVRGFRIAAGSDQNNLDQNAATTNGFNGFQVGGMQSTLTNNTATQNQFGFYIVDTLSGSSQHTLRRNTAALNTLLGFLDSDAEHLTLVKNVAQQNGDSGFLLFGSGHTVRQNQAFDNGNIGIDLHGTDSRMRQNTALGNAGDDLVDRNPDCGTNTWRKNIFSSLNMACIE